MSYGRDSGYGRGRAEVTEEAVIEVSTEVLLLQNQLK
jgi:hypothetical protein